MTKTTDALLDRMVKAIVDEVAPEQVILFGSRARGDATADSDVDLVVVEAAPFGPGRDPSCRSGTSMARTGGLRCFERYFGLQQRRGGILARFPEPCPARVLREGQVLYERP